MGGAVDELEFFKSLYISERDWDWKPRNGSLGVMSCFPVAVLSVEYTQVCVDVCRPC